MNAQAEAFKKKVRAELEQAKSRLAELEARSKAQDEQVLTDLISQLKSQRREIEKQQKKLETSAVQEMEQETTDIEAGIARLKDGLAKLDAKLNKAA